MNITAKTELQNLYSAKSKTKPSTASKARQAVLIKKLILLSVIAIVAGTAYLLLGINFKFFDYAMSLRVPKLAVMVIVGFCIGAATIVFQSIVNNTIVTPCLLGMNSLYTLMHTLIFFFVGSGSIIALNYNLAFMVDILVMGTVATFLYSFIFRKTKHNVLYVLLVGTVLTTFFSSMQSTMTRVMDPNEYDSLLSTLVASVSRANSQIIAVSLILIGLLIFALRKEIAVLDIIPLGKDQAINLGVDYDKTIRRLLLGVTLLITIATAMVGPISFLGLIVANIARQLMKTHKHIYLILASSLVGVIVLVGGQVLLERIFHYAVPVSVFINVGGGLYFLYLILRKRRTA